MFGPFLRVENFFLYSIDLSTVMNDDASMHDHLPRVSPLLNAMTK